MSLVVHVVCVAVLVVVVLFALMDLVSGCLVRSGVHTILSSTHTRCFCSGVYECADVMQLSPGWTTGVRLSLRDMCALVARLEIGLFYAVPRLYAQLCDADVIELGPDRLLPIGVAIVPRSTATTRARQVIFVFRGTASRSDWIQNARVQQTAAAPAHSAAALVHSGFRGLFAQVEARVRAVLDDVRPTHVTVAGHSMGGAVAALCALSVLLCGGEVTVRGLLMGTPRPGTAAFARLLAPADLTTLVNVADPVTALPFGSHYTHVGRVLAFEDPAPTTSNVHGLYVYWRFVTSLPA